MAHHCIVMKYPLDWFPTDMQVKTDRYVMATTAIDQTPIVVRHTELLILVAARATGHQLPRTLQDVGISMTTVEQVNPTLLNIANDN